MTPGRHFPVIAGQSGSYYDESGHPMLGSTLLQPEVPKVRRIMISDCPDMYVSGSHRRCATLCAAGNRRQRHTVLNSDTNLRERGCEYTDAVVGSK